MLSKPSPLAPQGRMRGKFSQPPSAQITACIHPQQHITCCVFAARLTKYDTYYKITIHDPSAEKSRRKTEEIVCSQK